MEHLRTSISLVCVATATILLAGCGEPNSSGTHDHSHDVGDHGHDHDGHDHASGDAHDESEDGHQHGTTSMLGTVEIAGTTLDVRYDGTVEPGAELHVNLEPTSGPKPVVVRLWVGQSSSEGSLKSKADATENGFHCHVELPADLADGSALWVEIEGEDGTRTTGSLPLPE